ncbi:MAG: hypothetical protein QM802_19800 [Agriterribacter sp.]
MAFKKPHFQPLLQLLKQYQNIEADPSQFLKEKAEMIIDGLIDIMLLLEVPDIIAAGVKDCPVWRFEFIKKDMEILKSGAKTYLTDHIVFQRFRLDCEDAHEYFEILDRHWFDSDVIKQANGVYNRS